MLPTAILAPARRPRRTFTAVAPDALWAGDITMITTETAFRRFTLRPA
ncbi:hypothetical protein [Streptosporangium canum]